MRRIVRKGAAILAVAAMAIGTLTGCGANMGSTVMATYGNEKVSKEETLFLTRYTQYSYEYGYQGYYNNASEFWSSSIQEDATMEDMVKESIMSSILQTKVLCDKANQDNIRLSEDEQTKIDEAVANIMKMEEVINASDVTEEVVKQVIRENALANKVYESIVADIDLRINEDDFLKKTMDVVSIQKKQEEASSPTTVSTETDSTKETAADASGQEGQQAAMQELGAKIKQELQDGKTLDDVKKNYENSEFAVTTSGDEAVGKSSNFPYANAAMELTKGQVTVVSTEDQGVYVVRCTEEKNEEATNQAIEDELQTRKDTMFQEKYKELSDQAPKFEVNDKEWKKVTFGEPVFVKPEETTGESDVQETGTEETGSQGNTEIKETAGAESLTAQAESTETLASTAESAAEAVTEASIAE